MRYYLDTEFNSYKGPLISMSLLRADLESLYMVFPRPNGITPWVLANVMPYINSVPNFVKVHRIFHKDAPALLEEFFKGDDDIEIVVDWPDDMQYLSELLLTGPGTMINIPRLRFTMERVDAWPLRRLPEPGWGSPVQHNAWWDSWALSELFFWQKHATSKHKDGEAEAVASE